ncbi:hypothetical protein DFH06DRAFT_1401520 [Mycena polygramma]|nr:hypothetical protein DFH06DRAFT_1401520 [Mycena polygramma]
MLTLLSSLRAIALLAVITIPGTSATFSTTCTGCTGISFNLTTDALTATCQRPLGSGTVTTSIDVNTCVGNTNGQLTVGRRYGALQRERFQHLVL